MPDTLRIAQVNAAYDARATSTRHLLDLYPTLCEWGDALQTAGAVVGTVQRFHRAAHEVRGQVHYLFARDSRPPVLPWWSGPGAVVEAVRAWRPDVVHVNGLQFPALLLALRSGVGQAVPIVVQDHAGRPPAVATGLGVVRRWYWRHGLAAVDACSFTAAAQAVPWQASGILRSQPVLEILEGSTSLSPLPRDDARAVTGLQGSPALLWVGRLTVNKDPLAVLSGLELALPQIPDARAYFIYEGGDLLDHVRARVLGSPVLQGRVELVGALPRHQMPAFFSAADIYISGSHREGSGYALLEALACGLAPVVTDIPSFRAIADPHASFWTPGDASSCAAAVLRASADQATGRQARQRHFERALSWPAVAARTLDAYSAIVRRRACTR